MFDDCRESGSISGNDTKQKRTGAVYKFGGTYTRILNLLYPKVCPFCGEISPEGVCAECKKKIIYVRQPRCMRCGKPIKDEYKEYCSDCAKRTSHITQGRSSLVSDALFRVKKTTAQKKLDRQERMGNLRDAFALSERWKPVANVLLIDDIYTTGATVEQAAKILKKAGAQNVYFLTISIGQGI